MKYINKIRIKEKRSFISGLILLAVLGISWFFVSYFAEVMFFMDYTSPDLSQNPESKYILLHSILTWERYVDSAMRYIVNYFPIFAVFPALAFLQERKTFFVFGAHRFLNYRKSLVQSILSYTLKSGLTLAIPFTIFFLIGNFFMYPSISNIGGFASIFSENFYMKHPCLFFLFLTWTVYFSFGMAFGLMTCGFALFLDKEIFILIIIIVFYLSECYIGYFFNFLPLKLSESICAFNTLYSTGEIFIPILFLFFFDIILVAIGIGKHRRFIHA